MYTFQTWLDAFQWCEENSQGDCSTLLADGTREGYARVEHAMYSQWPMGCSASQAE
jgi:hypothetical protein